MFFNGTLKIIFLLSGLYPFSVFLVFSTFFVLKRLQQEKATIIKCLTDRQDERSPEKVYYWWQRSIFFVSCAESIIGDKWLWTAVNATVINSFRDFFHLNGENSQPAVNSELKSLTAWQQKLNLSLFRDIRNNRITSIGNGTFFGITCSGTCSETSRNRVW